MTYRCGSVPAVQRLWADVLEVPESLQTTLDRSEGFAAVAEQLRNPEVRRVVATGNGAAYYVAHALWLASLQATAGPPVIAVPAGVIASGEFAWRPGDLPLVVSSSGELRDLVELIRQGLLDVPYVAVSSMPDSTIATHAAAAAIVHVRSQRAVTHTQAYCGNLAATLAIWAAATADKSLRGAVAAVPEVTAQAIEAADPTSALPADADPAAGIAFGAGPGWSAALEAALLLKELGRLPCEGQEAREGATSGMTGLGDDCLAVSIRTGSPLQLETEQQCAERGALVVPIDAGDDGRLAAITGFPGSVALAIAVAERKGLDVDEPAWTAAYYKTARTAADSTRSA